MNIRLSIGVTLLLMLCSISAIAVAQQPLKIVVIDAEPREFVVPVHEDLRPAADAMAVKALERFGGIDKRDGTSLNRRMRPAFLDVSALKADHRGIDIIIKKGKQEKFDWCIGEKMLLTLFPG